MEGFVFSGFINRLKMAAANHPGFALAAKVTFILALIIAWIKLYWPVFQYLNVQINREEFRTNEIVLLLVIGLIFYQARKSHLRLSLVAPQLYQPALALAIGGSAAYLLVERFLDINTLSAILFGLASYGLVGLWLAPERWRRGFPAMLLVVGVLPFGEHLETFVGYPLRTFTAGVVRDALNSAGFHSVGVDTILVFESGISQVDIPCSGVKSLWTGAMFLLAATWIRNKPLNLRWLGVAACTGLLLFIANLIRVGVLALTGPALGWTSIAQMLHLPLGVLGFVGTCAVVLSMIHRLPDWPEPIEHVERALLFRPAWLGPGLVLSVFLMALIYPPQSAVGVVSAAAPPVWRFSEGIKLTPALLTAQELIWIQEGGAETADRFSFQWQDPNQPVDPTRGPVNGTFMLLTSQTWRGQHRPERCFEVFGLTVNESNSILMTPEFPIRSLTLSSSRSPGLVSAVYWLQSLNQSTDDFGQRIWADLGPNRERWVLVTVLFDRVYDPHSPELSSFLTSLHDSIDQSLKKGK